MSGTGRKGAESADRRPVRSTRNQASTDAIGVAIEERITDEANLADSGYPFDFKALTADIRDTVATVVEEKMVGISDKLDTIQNTLDGNTKRLGEAESRISDAEDTIANMDIRIMDAESRLVELTKRMDEQESRMRRDQLRIFGVREGVEGKNVVSYFETWLPRLLNMETKKGRIRLDRCHRSLGKPKAGVPRAIIMKPHYATDAMTVMTLSKKMKLQFEGATISIRQDLPQTVLQQRRKFNPACQKLITKGIRFRMQYPATLRFIYNDKNFIFDSPDEAICFTEALGEPCD